jgi:hypothetical protein
LPATDWVFRHQVPRLLPKHRLGPGKALRDLHSTLTPLLTPTGRWDLHTTLIPLLTPYGLVEPSQAGRVAGLLCLSLAHGVDCVVTHTHGEQGPSELWMVLPGSLGQVLAGLLCGGGLLGLGSGPEGHFLWCCGWFSQAAWWAAGIAEVTEHLLCSNPVLPRGKKRIQSCLISVC